MCGWVAQAGKMTTGFSAALARLNHRGIRSKVVESQGGTVGHVRLPIVGVDEANDQPVRRGPWTIAFVGEILDFRDRIPDVPCDLYTVTRAWMMLGPRGLNTRDGFWSVVALNDIGDLHILCDYLAQKPTYYRADARAAASEPDALLCLGPVTPDEIYLSAVVKWGYCPEVERTPYKEVKHVLPGEHVIIHRDGEVSRWIVDPLTPLPCTPMALKHELVEASRRRAQSSDVPIACLLSGGLDSSVAYALASRYAEVRPYYVTTTEEANSGNLDERCAVGAVAGRQRVTEVTYDEVSPVAALAVMQEPIDLGSLIPQVSLAQAVEETVCITGDGADECFGGYGRAARYDSQGSDLFHELPAWHLPRLDRVMMRNRVEVRTPFLARRVVQMALGLPYSERQDKKIIRDLFRSDLPPGVADRKKKPLRTSTIENSRESNSLSMVDTFRRRVWGGEQQRIA